MSITDEMIREVTADLYSWALRKVPDDTMLAMAAAMQIRSAEKAQDKNTFVCSDSGVPVTGDLKKSIRAGWPEMISHYRVVQLEVVRLGPLVVTMDNVMARRASIIEQMGNERSL